tara:strand:+ start:348 stop:602 length:255 start_codon:yes stop_codon:yes gene_type:complete
MKRKHRINNLLKDELKEFSIQIEDKSNLHKGHNNFDGKGETHIKIILNKKNKIKIDRLELHRKINNLLKQEFDLGLHSLEIRVK